MTPKRPRDPNQLAKSIIDIATGQLSQSSKMALQGARKQAGRKVAPQGHER
jgi:hypothetical protein